MKKSERPTQFYQHFTDDFVTSAQQNYQLPPDYHWLPERFYQKLWAKIVFVGVRLFAVVYCKFCLHIRFQNRHVLKSFRHQGFVIYGNHTQPQGDAFTPMILLGWQGLNFICSPANLGMPILGKLVPYGGGLPIPNDIKHFGAFQQAIATILQRQHALMIYPEAHVWPYYTQIRPFPLAAFHYPIANHCASFCLTTTYQASRWHRKPKIAVYVDGPFLPDAQLTPKTRQKQLAAAVHQKMEQRSSASTYEWIHYRKE